MLRSEYLTLKCIGNLTLKNSNLNKKIIKYEWNKSAFGKMIHILKTGSKNL